MQFMPSQICVALFILLICEANQLKPTKHSVLRVGCNCVYGEVCLTSGFVVVVVWDLGIADILILDLICSRRSQTDLASEI